MNLQQRLKRLQSNLEDFDLETFFHDETFEVILDDRKILEDDLSKLSARDKDTLFMLDNIIWSYFNIYKKQDLKGFARLSFQILEDVVDISQNHLTCKAA